MLTEGNTLLDDKELEMLVILRMNRKWARVHYKDLISKLANGTRTSA